MTIYVTENTDQKYKPSVGKAKKKQQQKTRHSDPWCTKLKSECFVVDEVIWHDSCYQDIICLFYDTWINIVYMLLVEKCLQSVSTSLRNYEGTTLDQSWLSCAYKIKGNLVTSTMDIATGQDGGMEE